MNRLLGTTAALFLIAGMAQAQFLGRPTGSGSGTPSGGTSASPLGGGIGAPPTSGGTSPYLNLTRGGNSAAVNYYGIVRPQFNFQNSLQALQTGQQPGTATQGPDDALSPGIVVGTRARFLNTGGVFLNLNGATTATTTAGPTTNASRSTLSAPLGSTQSIFGSGIGGSTGGSRGPRN